MASPLPGLAVLFTFEVKEEALECGVNNSVGLSTFIINVREQKNSVEAADEAPSTQYQLRRSLQDFEWLNRRLKVESPGVIIPAVPTSMTIQNLTQRLEVPEKIRSTYLEQGVQRFLEKCGAHPLLQRNSDFRAFLDCTQDELNKRKASTQKNLKTSVMGDGMTFLKRALFSSNSTDTRPNAVPVANTGGSPLVGVAYSGEDEYFDTLVEQGSSHEFLTIASNYVRATSDGTETKSDAGVYLEQMVVPRLLRDTNYFFEARLDESTWAEVENSLRKAEYAMDTYRDFYETIIRGRREAVTALQSIGGTLKHFASTDREFHSENTSQTAHVLNRIAEHMASCESPDLLYAELLSVIEPLVHHVDMCRAAQEALAYFLVHAAELNRRANSVIELIASREKIFNKNSQQGKVLKIEDEIEAAIVRRDEYQKVVLTVCSILRKDLIDLYCERRKMLQESMSSFLMHHQNTKETMYSAWEKLYCDLNMTVEKSDTGSPSASALRVAPINTPSIPSIELVQGTELPASLLEEPCAGTEVQERSEVSTDFVPDELPDVIVDHCMDEALELMPEVSQDEYLPSVVIEPYGEKDASDPLPVVEEKMDLPPHVNNSDCSSEHSIDSIADPTGDGHPAVLIDPQEDTDSALDTPKVQAAILNVQASNHEADEEEPLLKPSENTPSSTRSSIISLRDLENV